MLNFTDHIKRISYLSNRTLVHVQDEKFDSALEDLINIYNNVNEATRQIYEMILMKNQGKK